MSILEKRIIARISGSPHRLTLVFPAAVASPTSTPVNPFGPTPVTTALPAVTTPSRAPVTVTCLWADGVNPGDLESHSEALFRREVGWYAEATAVARVLVSDVALDVTNPWGATLLDQAHHVEFGGKVYEMVQYTPIAAGFRVPVSYAVWLKGAQQQTT